MSLTTEVDALPQSIILRKASTFTNLCDSTDGEWIRGGIMWKGKRGKNGKWFYRATLDRLLEALMAYEQEEQNVQQS